MDGWIRSLSDRGVFALVLVLALGFGWPIYYSLSAALSGQPPAPIRIAYHLYQGSAGVVSIVPMGLAYAWLYARTGRLWPLVLAHVCWAPGPWPRPPERPGAAPFYTDSTRPWQMPE
ncbi:CPBP family intramembrane glutamic endopeptidase [Lysobacter gummosus]|uniref:CPBP family intramembrane glutamic endopeptidase n=1 Tax=Lysobacter gummosus TaxID=262324 RepID=UPI00363933AE